MTTQLTQAQRDLLTVVAAAGDAGHVVEVVADLRTAKTLIKRGLCVSLADEPDLRIAATEEGRAILAADALAGEATPEPTQAEPAPEASASLAPREPKGKLGELVVLLRQPQGAGIAEMTVATGWQAHSVRGAMSGALKKRLGLAVTSEKSEQGRVYRIAADEVAQ
jgi:hypothetical protein